MFQELCARPLWTNDYLKMTQVFHTVLIRNIPILSQKNRSEARRFICLVDTLYDHKLRVVASGAAPYWELFQVSATHFMKFHVLITHLRTRRSPINKDWTRAGC